MATIAKIATGTLLKIGDAATPTELFTLIPEIVKLSGPSIKFDLLDASSHDSGAFREFVPGFADGDFIRFQGNWRPSNVVHKGVRIDAYARTKRNFQIVFPDTTDNTVLSATYITMVEPKADAGTLLTWDGQLKVTGAPTWT